jgi:hypothetical protein
MTSPWKWCPTPPRADRQRRRYEYSELPVPRLEAEALAPPLGLATSLHQVFDESGYPYQGIAARHGRRPGLRRADPARSLQLDPARSRRKQAADVLVQFIALLTHLGAESLTPFPLVAVVVPGGQGNGEW